MKLYLDIDGVLNPFPNMGKMGDYDDFKNFDVPFDGRKLTLRLSQKMVDELKSLPVEIVFNTTWCAYPNELDILAKHLTLDETRRLCFDEEVSGALWRHYRNQKALQLVKDVQQHQEPFIWIDDEAIDLDARSYLRANIDAPYFLVTPNPRTGITLYDIEAIKNFIQETSHA